MLQNISVFKNAVLLIFFSSNNKKVSWFPQKYEAAQLFLILIKIRNVSLLLISEGSCDTEDCGNDAENSALLYILNYIKIEI